MSNQLNRLTEKDFTRMEDFLKLIPENWRGPVAFGYVATSFAVAIRPIVMKIINQRATESIVERGHNPNQLVEIIDVVATDTMAA